MSTAGIIAEYNPFHNGHLYQVRQVKETLGCSHIVSVMSGDFLQRGVPAVCNKYMRAEMAVSCGIDAVFELPAAFATASAGDFAMAGVLLLDKLQSIDYLVFGAECDDLALLNEISDIFLQEPDAFSCTLKQNLALGMSYPAARAKALTSYCSQAADIISAPNNILAIEYLSALKKCNSTIKPYIIKRKGAEYNSIAIDSDICSASAIRHYLQAEEPECKQLQEQLAHVLPEPSLALFLREFGKTFPVFENDFSAILQYKLIMQEACPETDGMTPELYNKLRKAGFHHSYAEFVESVKSKEITQSRISRTLLRYILNIDKEDITLYKKNGWISYGHILALKKSGSEILKQIKKNSTVPVFTKTADGFASLDEAGRKMLTCDISATRLYNSTVYNKFEEELPDDFTVRLPVK